MANYFLKSAQFLLDVFILSLAYWLAFLFRFEFNLDLSHFKLLFFTWPYVILFQYSVLILFQVPRFSWRYIGLKETIRIAYAIGFGTFILIIFRLTLIYVGGYAKFVVLPLGVLAMYFIMAFLGIVGIRVLRRITTEREERNKIKRNSKTEILPTLLVGAGRAGVLVAKELAQNPHLGMKILGFVDDDKSKQKSIIQGFKVLGNTDSLKILVAKYEVQQVVITIAAARGSDIRRIVSICKDIPIPVKIIPGIYEILDGKINLSRIREVTIEDLLGREPIELETENIEKFLKDKTVLVTGAGGSIGSEMLRQLARFDTGKLILLEQAENALFEISEELKKDFPQKQIIPLIADVCDSRRIDNIFESYKPQIIYHAAAHKHVPMMELNPGEAIKNNIFGTKTVADAAGKHKCDSFVMISTDKAVNPTSIMGATKRVAEIYVQSQGEIFSTRFTAVRFGNVLGSAGSVIPIFKKQIENGGPVTVTDPKMKRYFMTIPEACQLVMQSAVMGEKSEIFVLDMGKPVLIKNLAADLIRLSGYDEDEIAIEYTGTRPGEKLFEELGTSGEDMKKTRHPKIFIGRIEQHSLEKIKTGLNDLKEATDCSDSQKVRTALKKLVPEMMEPHSDAS